MIPRQNKVVLNLMEGKTDIVVIGLIKKPRKSLRELVKTNEKPINVSRVNVW